tara:strand:+ start:1350 stop:2444 length:1095 start_codon:yes stop_codon:yes gene_type:complete
MTRIEPYSDKEVKFVLQDLLKDKQFLDFVKNNLNSSTSKFLSIPGSKFLALQLFKSKVRKINSIDEFQDQVKIVLQSVIDQTIDEFNFSGIDQLDTNKPYLFISNHRDITLDSALCNHAISTIGLETTHNAIGDNLVSIKWMGDLLRLNKSFVIERGGKSKKAIYNNLFKVSNYIKETLKAGNHVWIAQRQGRAKDGIDKTDPAVLKMLHIALRKDCDFDQLTKYYNVIPCSVSYEYDPLTVEKAKHLIEGQEKNKEDDIKHIFKGIMTPKGFVHLNLGDQIKGNFSPEELSKEIDKSILSNYKVWETNMYSYKYLHETVNDDDFPRASIYFNNLRASMTNKELEYIMTQYANPIIAKGELTNE